MTMFDDILSEMFILTEDASVDSINTAISGMHPAWIRYDDGKPNPKNGRRLIYPVAYGLTKAGNPVVRAFQPQGSTRRGVPKWKFFRLDRVKFWRTVSSKTFNPEELEGFNDEGDNSMSVLYNISPIGNASKLTRTKKDDSEIIGAKPISKDDIDNVEVETPREQPKKGRMNGKHVINNIINGLKNLWKRPKQEKTVDNNKENDYPESKKMVAPETEPIKKNDLNIINSEPMPQAQQQNITAQTNEPIKQTDIDNETEEVKQKFQNLTNRMDNLYKDED